MKYDPWEEMGMQMIDESHTVAQDFAMAQFGMDLDDVKDKEEFRVPFFELVKKIYENRKEREENKDYD